MAARAIRRSTARRQASGLVADFGEMLEHLAKSLFDAYRPELHYMRGPGPAWHAKHDRIHERRAVGFDAMPALAPVRIKGGLR
jgi:hypothetical protein